MSKQLATAVLKSVPGSALMFGKKVSDAKEDNETHEQYEHRTWRQKVHVDDQTGQVFIPPFALKNAFESAGKWLSMPIKGEGKKTFTKRFTSGTLVIDRIMLTHNNKPITMDDVAPQVLFVPSDGKRGSARRVERIFPTVTSWAGEARIWVLDPKISDDVLLKHMECIGSFVGFGSMRVENGGVNGRFVIEDFDMQEVE